MSKWSWQPIRARFERAISIADNGCWLWTGCTSHSGYGVITLDGRQRHAHRAMFILTRGYDPPGLVIDHLCSTPLCVNPYHLEAVTQRINVLRGNSLAAQRARQTHCKRGHEFTTENTYVTKRRERSCRACHAACEQRRRDRLAQSGATQ